jgi:hypothetical protein
MKSSLKYVDNGGRFIITKTFHNIPRAYDIWIRELKSQPLISFERSVYIMIATFHGHEHKKKINSSSTITEK